MDSHDGLWRDGLEAEDTLRVVEVHEDTLGRDIAQDTRIQVSVAGATSLYLSTETQGNPQLLQSEGREEEECVSSSASRGCGETRFVSSRGVVAC